MTTETDTNHEQQAIELKAKYEGLAVVDQPTFLAMEALGLTAKESQKAIENHLKADIDAAHAKHMKLTAIRKRLTAPFKDIAKGAKAKCIAYDQEQERKAAEEAKRKEDEALKAAEKAEAAGLPQVAEKILEQPAEPKYTRQKTAGARKNWKAEITDIPALLKAIAEGHKEISVRLLDKDDLARVLGLGYIARTHHDKVEVPGVKFYSVMQ